MTTMSNQNRSTFDHCRYMGGGQFTRASSENRQQPKPTLYRSKQDWNICETQSNSRNRIKSCSVLVCSCCRSLVLSTNRSTEQNVSNCVHVQLETSNESGVSLMVAECTKSYLTSQLILSVLGHTGGCFWSLGQPFCDDNRSQGKLWFRLSRCIVIR